MTKRSKTTTTSADVYGLYEQINHLLRETEALAQEKTQGYEAFIREALRNTIPKKPEGSELEIPEAIALRREALADKAWSDELVRRGVPELRLREAAIRKQVSILSNVAFTLQKRESVEGGTVQALNASEAAAKKELADSDKALTEATERLKTGEDALSAMQAKVTESLQGAQDAIAPARRALEEAEQELARSTEAKVFDAIVKAAQNVNKARTEVDKCQSSAATSDIASQAAQTAVDSLNAEVSALKRAHAGAELRHAYARQRMVEIQWDRSTLDSFHRYLEWRNALQATRALDANRGFAPSGSHEIEFYFFTASHAPGSDGGTEPYVIKTHRLLALINALKPIDVDGAMEAARALLEPELEAA